MPPRAAPPNSSVWKLADVLDFEHFLSLDREQASVTLAQRDLSIFTERIEPRLPAEAPPRAKLWGWLEARRSHASEVTLPGAIFDHARRGAAWLLAVVGFSFGALVAVLHLVYYGAKPINVVVFLTVTLLPQWLLLLALLLGSLGKFRGFGITQLLLRGLINLREKALAHADGEQRLGWQSFWGVLKTKQALYSRLWPWTLLRLTQVFAIAFNLGLLSTLLLLITVSNRAFGWETTLKVGPDAMFSAVQTFAAPWSWLPEAHPTLAQIVGSRVALQGVGAYPAEALVAWWPFLCYALLFYGLLPRVALWLWSCFAQRQALHALPFTQADARQILRRMEPLVSTGPAGAELENARVSASPTHAHGDGVLIISSDLEFDSSRLEPALRRRGWRVTTSLRAAIDAGEPDAELLCALLPKPNAVVVVIDAARPPIKAMLLFLSGLRAALARETEIAVLLVAAEVAAENLAIWRQKLAMLHDPFLSVESEELR